MPFNNKEKDPRMCTPHEGKRTAGQVLSLCLLSAALLPAVCASCWKAGKGMWGGGGTTEYISCWLRRSCNKQRPTHTSRLLHSCSLAQQVKYLKTLLNTYTRFPPGNAHRQQRPNCLQQTHQRPVYNRHIKDLTIYNKHIKDLTVYNRHSRDMIYNTHSRGKNCLQLIKKRHELSTTYIAET